MTTSNTSEQTSEKTTAQSKTAEAPKTEQPSAKLIAAQEELLQLEVEAKRLEVLEKKERLENERLSGLEKKANIEDLNERLAERQLKRDTVRQTSLTNGATLKSLDEEAKKVQRRCNHRKGGQGAEGVVGGQGDSTDYAVIKHIVLNSDMWIRCQRCGKTWKPPVKEHFTSTEEYLKAVAEYEQAKLFPTKNKTSSSYEFRFSDNGAYFREVTRHTTLR